MYFQLAIQYFFVVRMSLNSFFHIPIVKDDTMRLVCVIINIFLAGPFLPFVLISRCWYHYCWCSGRNEHPCDYLWYPAAGVRQLRSWLHLVLGVGLLHLYQEASVQLVH